MTRHFSERMWLLAWAFASVGLSVCCLVLFVLTVVSIPLIAVWVGIPLLFVAVLAVRPIANVHRRVAGRLLDREIARPYLKPTRGNLLARLRDLVAGRATWRDLAWVAASGTAGLALSIVSIIEAVLDLIFWWLPAGMMARVNAYLAAALLAPTKATTLAQRVQELATTRAETRDASAAEIRRIERDLHDGAQARLVALGMNLAVAEDLLATDPESARTLIAEARETSRSALDELRDLVRGVHPPVLADRGLVGAVRALALTSPIPIDVGGDATLRYPPPVESAAYFAIAEAVGNIVKHSGASAATITIERLPGGLHLTVHDDGRGGADPSGGTGLRGIERRLAAFDGTLRLSSPPGGPTELSMVVPT